MPRQLVVLAIVSLLAASCSSARHHTPEATEDNFGVRMAQQNLWREAMFRFQRAVQLDPKNAMAHNNLAVAFEANGEFDKAAKEYREAMRLDKSNQYIQKNYSRFVEFTSRNKKRQLKQAPGAPATKTASATSDTPETATTATPPTAVAAPPVPTAESPGPPPQPTGTAPAAPPNPPPPVKPPGDLP